MDKHTPGPWTLEVVRDERKAAEKRLAAWGVVHRPGTHSIETNLADARLIAAAPRMLAALRAAQEALDVLAEDAEEAGYPTRADAATKQAMDIRAILRDVEG